MNKPLFYVLLALIFAAGVLAGVILDKKALQPKPTAPPAARAEETGNAFARERPFERAGKFFRDRRDNPRKHFVEMLSRQLSLTAKQKKQVEQILKKNEPGILALREDMDKRMTALHVKMNKQLETVLNADQVKRLHEIDERMQKMGPPPPGDEFGGPGGPGESFHGGPHPMRDRSQQRFEKEQQLDSGQ